MRKIYIFALALSCLFFESIAQNLPIVVSKPAVLSRQDATVYVDGNLMPFYHGVASGDPLSDRVIIWTRVTPDDDNPVLVNWYFSKDPNLTSIVKSGSITTDQSSDFTVKIDVLGLLPNTTYYYGFSALGKNSLIGRTKTAPTGDVSNLKFAVVSCSNYQQGYFNAYARIAERNDLNAVIHLGDYIYEYPEGGYGYTPEVGRGHEPKNEIITLTDYRVRYSYYRLDPDLRRLHQQLPFITTWDDHEFANDAYKDGAENHQPATEGDWNVRKNNAYKAYFEWMPVRSPEVPNRIYRVIKYGNMLDLLMLDTRMEGRDQQPGLSGFEAVAKNMERDLSAIPNARKEPGKIKSVLEKYLPLSLNYNSSISISKIDDNVLDKNEFNYVVDKVVELISNYNDDIRISDLNLKEAEIQKLQTLIISSTKKFHTPDNNRTQARTLLGSEQYSWLTQNLKNSTARWKVLGNQVMMEQFQGFPSNDSWDGYPEEREALLGFVRDNKINNVVVITGDIHCTFSADLPVKLSDYNVFTGNGSRAVEFVTPSITSANFKELSPVPLDWLKYIIAIFNPHMKGVELVSHGYLILNLSTSKAQSDWYYVNNITSPSAGQKFAFGYYTNANANRLKKAPAAIAANTGELPAPPAPLLATSVSSTVLSMGAYPNPANQFANIHYAVSAKQEVTIELKDEQGKLIQTIFKGMQEPALYNINLNIRPLKEGLYFYTIQTSEKVINRRLMIKR